METNLVGFFNISKKTGEHSGPFAIWMLFGDDDVGVGGGDDDG